MEKGWKEEANIGKEGKRVPLMKHAVVAALAMLIVFAFGMTACSSGSSSTSKGNATDEQRTSAKQVVIAAGDLLTMMDLGITEEDSPITISDTDPQYADFFDALKTYKKVADLDVSNVTITAKVAAVNASTARPDQQTNYRFTITGATMTVNGADMTFTAPSSFETN